MWETTWKRRLPLGQAFLFLSLLGAARGQQAPSNTGFSNLAFFNASLSSQVIINTILNLTQHTVFSFRTCSHGTLLSQTGSEGDSLSISLTEEGSLELYWRTRTGISDSVIVGTRLSKSQWYTVELNYLLGSIHLRVEQGSNELYKELISNSTFRRYLWDLDLRGGQGLFVGQGFTGCIEHGAGVQFTTPGTQDTNVRWGECPLDSPTVRGCDLQQFNPCYSFPCLNGGTCQPNGTVYQCKCPVPFSGNRCEQDLGDKACSLEPCQNGGTCSIVNSTSSRRVICNCPSGFAGLRCESNIDECGSLPCMNGGQCKDELDGFTCICTGTGYNGTFCELNIDECATMRPCVNNGTCINTRGSYKCKCPVGYAGLNCEQDLDECVSSPCQNDGVCTDYLGMYRCTCKEGFTGPNCETDIDDCVDHTCEHPKTCVDGVNTYTCECSPGYQETVDGDCQDVNECESAPCQNGATCVNEENQYTCLCAPGYHNTNCDVDINECWNVPCKNGGTCHDEVGQFRCECPRGYTDATCSTDIDECQSTPCQNGATCLDEVAGFLCDCPLGLNGTFCENNINECLSSPCQNGATCFDEINGYNCLCLDGFDGVHCEQNIDECLALPCQNEATCIDGINNYTCACSPRWMGQNCNELYDACAFIPCQNGGTCTSTLGTQNYTCQCVPGFTGTSCETNIDDCIGNTCESFQVCVDGIVGYTCQCPLGYTGDRCDEDIDECESGPCLHGGTCRDLVGNYSCECSGQWIDLRNFTKRTDHRHWSGYTGRNCEERTRECSYDPPVCLNGGLCKENNDTGYKCFCSSQSSDGETSFYTGYNCGNAVRQCDLAEDKPPCFNGATCHNQEHNYTCSCAPGYTGPRCRINIDECRSSPCQNNGTCVDDINGYTCQCKEGFSGPHCEIDVNECESSPCVNGGRCMDAVNRFTCDCGDTGFEGVNCEINVDDCQPNPCEYGGTCQDGIKEYFCACHSAFMGSKCEIDPDECASSPCLNGATCLQRSNQSRLNFSYETAEGFDCHCAPGYTGTFCEQNIDECLSAPCVYGACQDRINEYYCLCDSGYEGQNCDREINECTLYNACKNGATCIDRVANYFCVCAPEDEGVLYGGVNCTTLLTGCQGNSCQNGAKCLPYLISEVNGTHDYNCKCLPGFTGSSCEMGTTASFNGSSWLKFSYSKQINDLYVAFSFRTTLPNGTLFYVSDETNTNRIYVMLTEERTLIMYAKFTDNNVRTDTLQTFRQRELNDAEWHTVMLEVNGTNIVLKLDHEDCLQSLCETSITLDETAITLKDMYFGGLSDGDILQSLRSLADPFIGCLQDVKVGNDWVIPGNYIGGGGKKSSHLVLGCDRKAPCQPQPCQNGGQCLDLWDEFVCECVRPFIGETCNVSVIPATFGYRDTSSYVKFYIPLDLQINLAKINIISFFFRTRKANGFLCYLGPENNGGETFLQVLLVDGFVKVLVQVHPSDNPELIMDQQRYDDGQQHFLFINRTNGHLSVTVDNQKKERIITDTWGLQASVMWVGGMVRRGSGRKKRQANRVDTDDYKGTFLDLRLNGQLLEFYPVNAIGSPPLLSLNDSNNIQAGEVDDDLCNQGEIICEQNATCESVFYNDYKCHCPEGFKGKNCSELNFCIYKECPGVSVCNDLLDGHECVIPATFNGASTRLTYTKGYKSSLSTSTSIKLAMRTRETSGVILQLSSPRGQFVALEMKENFGLLLRYNISEFLYIQSEKVVRDGLWHNVSVSILPDKVTLNVDGEVGEALFTRNPDPNSLSNFLDGNIEISVGGPAGTTTTNPTFFKGCLDTVRIDKVLLPYFYLSEGYNSSASKQFFLTDKQNVETGCNGDPVCDTNKCTNGATCVDVWNEYTCNCPVGFNGSLCENNIDDCVGHECLNGAFCLDGIANYTCQCLPGYTGDRCQTDIDECASDPCQNNATCYDDINGYSCNCTANYTGLNCEVEVTEKCDNETNYPCVNGTCHTVNTSYAGVVTFECRCLAGYTGHLCESEIDYCADSPCVNGSCTSRTELTDYECTCYSGYMGKNCSEEIDECASQPCQNGGNCTDKLAGFECECPDGWTGLTCESDINECNLTWYNDSSPCERGVCINLDGTYECDCSGTGYTGDRCELEIDECELEPPVCKNGGSCINTNGSYSCNCSIGYEGTNCTNPNCTGVCLYDGNCSVTENETWACQCPSFHEGDRCEFRGPCVDQPCQNEGTCDQRLETEWNYTCKCVAGWTGPNCTMDVDECYNNPCLNDGVCINTPGGYKCNCPPGFTGTNCETDIDECDSQPCKNGGTCTDLINGYNCTCNAGSTGNDCGSDINECDDETICNNGNCTNKEHDGYECHCPNEFLGKNCEFGNPCENNPCLSQGNCTGFMKNSTTPWYKCHCFPEFEGIDCSEKVGGLGDGDGVPYNLIIGISLFALLLIIMIAVISFLLIARNKRATRGTYSPSTQEVSGSRVEMGNVLKPPPEERLI